MSKLKEYPHKYMEEFEGYFGFRKVDPEDVKDLEHFEDMGGKPISDMYSLCTWGDPELAKMYVQRYRFESDNASQWIVWYRNTKKMFISYGRTRIEALVKAKEDAWLYA